jgi:hypothetical protein
MSWTIRRSNVRLNVRPHREWDVRRRAWKPVAGLSKEAREALRARRARECLKFELTQISSRRPL